MKKRKIANNEQIEVLETGSTIKGLNFQFSSPKRKQKRPQITSKEPSTDQNKIVQKSNNPPSVDRGICTLGNQFYLNPATYAQQPLFSLHTMHQQALALHQHMINMYQQQIPMVGSQPVLLPIAYVPINMCQQQIPIPNINIQQQSKSKK